MALILATWDIQSLYLYFLSMLGMFIGGLAGLFALGIFTRRATPWGSLVGAGASAAMMVVIKVKPNWFVVHGMLYGVISFSVCALPSGPV